MRYYLIRVYNTDGSPLQTRCEKAGNPRDACKLAFGVIYDNSYNTARYLDIGSRKPNSISRKKLEEMEKNGPWLPIPKS